MDHTHRKKNTKNKNKCEAVRPQMVHNGVKRRRVDWERR